MKNEDLFDYHFPRLYGSKDQRKWAESIRLPVVIQLAEMLRAHFQDGFDQDSLTSYLEVLMGRYPNARWWIEFEQEPTNAPIVEYFWNELSWFTHERSMQITDDHKGVKLVVFEINNVITNTPYVDQQPLHILPGRFEAIYSLMREGKHVAFVANRGEVPYGIKTEQDVWDEVSGIVHNLIAESFIKPFYTVCFANTRPEQLSPNKRFDVKYSTPEMLYRRMPNPGMLEEAMKFYNVRPHEVVVVGASWECLYAARTTHTHTFYDACTYFAEKSLPDPPHTCEQIFNW